jgi:Chalcone isomerase-like
MRSSSSLVTIILIAACAVSIWTTSGLLSKNAFAQPVQTVTATVPKQSVGIDDAQLVGAGRLKFWGFDVYDAKLWAPSSFVATEFTKHPFALDITYLRDFSQTDVVQRSMQEMRDLVAVSDDKATQWEAQLRKSLPAIRKGDRLVGSYKPNEGASFTVNGKALDDIRDPELARAFFSIWLNPRTTAPALRRALLGLEPQTKAKP